MIDSMGRLLYQVKKMVQSGPEWSKIIHMVHNAMVQNSLKKIVQYGLIWSNIVHNHNKIIQMCQAHQPGPWYSFCMPLGSVM